MAEFRGPKLAYLHRTGQSDEAEEMARQGTQVQIVVPKGSLLAHLKRLWRPSWWRSLGLAATAAWLTRHPKPLGAFWEAAALADQLEECTHLWAPLPELSDVACFAARLGGVPFSFRTSLGALFREGPWLAKKVGAAQTVVAPTQICVDWMLRRFPAIAAWRVQLIREGGPQSVLEETAPKGEFSVVVVAETDDAMVTFIDACHILIREKGIPICGFLVGRHPLIQRRIRQYGFERTLTLVEEPDWHVDALVYLACSIDHVPEILLQATARGLVLAVTDLPSLRELVVPGQSGVGFAPNDPFQLAKALEQISQRPAWAANLAKAAQQRAKEEFNLETNVSRLLDTMLPRGQRPMDSP